MTSPETSSETSFRLWLRYLAIGLGIVILLWLPVEDSNSQSALIIALSICILAALHFLLSHPVHNRKVIIFYAIAGCLVGVAIILLALLLIAIKSGLHGHGFSDYSTNHITNIL